MFVGLSHLFKSVVRTMFLLCSGFILVFLYWYSTRTFSYWKEKAVKHDPPIPVLGNNARNFFGKRSRTQINEELYRKYPNEKIVGFYRYTQPEVLIRDPELVKRVLTTDFGYLYSRDFVGDSEAGELLEPLRRNLLVSEGDLWRLLRHSCTPAFSSGKLKAMFPLVVERAERLVEVTTQLSKSDTPIDARDLMARFTIDFIGACAFGLEPDALNDENSEFRKLGKKLLHVDVKQFFVFLLKFMFPGKFRSLKLYSNVEKDFVHLVREVQKKRNHTPSRRSDFIDLLMEIKAKGRMECESMLKQKPDGTPERASLEFNDELMAAQVMVFFGAGFETSSSSTSITLHHLAYNPDKQKKAQEEIDRVLAKNGNKLSWDAVNEMQYLEWTFSEGMRMVSPVGTLNRTCRRKYTFPGTNVTIDKDTRVTMCIHALHHDPRYWDKPEEFRPERFSPEEFNEAAKQAYFPFGDGPRACIGKRLGLMQSLAGLAAILSKFTVEPAPNSMRNPIWDPKSNVITSMVGGLPLLFKDRKKF